MNWLDIFCFTSVARTNSFSITARELMISQQAVSRHIRTLEEELDLVLFVRNSQNVCLTRAGEYMLGYFSARDKLLRQYLESVRPAAEQPIRLGWDQWLGCPVWLRDAISTFQSLNPRARLLVYDLNWEEMSQSATEGNLDLLLTTHYGATHLPVAWKEDKVSEEPIYLMGNSRINYDINKLSLYTQIAAPAGESDESGIRARVARLCIRIGFVLNRLEIYPNMGSVSLNVLMKKALAFGTKIDAIGNNGDYSMLSTGVNASVVLCRPFDGNHPLAAQLEALILEKGGAVL